MACGSWLNNSDGAEIINTCIILSFLKKAIDFNVLLFLLLSTVETDDCYRLTSAGKD